MSKQIKVLCRGCGREQDFRKNHSLMDCIKNLNADKKALKKYAQDKTNEFYRIRNKCQSYEQGLKELKEYLKFEWRYHSNRLNQSKGCDVWKDGCVFGYIDSLNKLNLLFPTLFGTGSDKPTKTKAKVVTCQPSAVEPSVQKKQEKNE